MIKVTTFSQEIKEEIATRADVTNEYIISLLSAFIRSNGTLNFRNRMTNLILDCENAKVAKFIYSCLKAKFNDVSMHFTFHKMMNFNKNIRYVIEIEDASKVLELLYIDFLDNKINYNLTDKEGKIKYYLAGLFLASGSCNDPSTSNYHLEISTKDEGFAKAIVKLTMKIKTVNFNFKISQRRNNYIVYIKKSDLISDFLAYVDATESCLKFENVRVDRDFNNVTNRLMNCDSYNFKKTLDISNKQIAYINFIDARKGINSIDNLKMKLICKLRLKYPEANFNELATYLSEEMGMSVSKSNVSHYFTKIKEMAIDLGYED